jgi:hypothetical protein
MIRRAVITVGLALIALCVAVAPAFAASGRSHASSGSKFPFTGMDLQLVAMAAGILGLIGLALAALIRAQARTHARAARRTEAAAAPRSEAVEQPL